MNTLFQRKEDCLLLIAYASLKQWDEPVDKENISAEKARIDRVISDIYSKNKLDVDYNQFVLEFVKEHGREIVYGNEFTYDVEVPDDATELDVNVMIDKYIRKQNGSKY